MSIEKEIINECSKLIYTKAVSLDEGVIDDTAYELRGMWRKYGYCRVLAALSEVWTFDKAVTFFSSFKRSVCNGNRPRTIATIYPRGYNGGVERVNAELMTLWVEMGYNVVFFTSEEKNPLDYQYPASIKRIVISASNMFERLEQLQTYCLSEQVDLLVYHDWTNQNFIWECMLMKMMKISIVLYCHGHFSWCFSCGKAALYQPEAFKLCDLVISLSETSARFYQLCGCDSYAIHNPIPSDLKLCVPSITRKRNHILLIGRISNEKFPMEAMKIFKIVYEKHPNVVLDIVGDGDEDLVREMKAFADDNGFSSSVVFYGNKGVEQIKEFYHSCGLMLFTSKMEGYPMVVLESKAYGIPLVMYEMPFLSLTKDGLGILTAPVGDIDKMADNVVSLIRDDELYKDLEDGARKSFMNLLSIDHKSVWDNIISIACEGKTVENPSYYRASELNDVDGNIMPALLEKVKLGYDNELYGSLNYKIGKWVLKYPRSVKNLMNRLHKF